MVKLKTVIENIVIWGIFVILAYSLKVILSFAIYIIVLDEECGIIDSIIKSMKISTRKNNITKIVLYNIIFLVILFVSNIFGLLGEIIAYFVFVGNEVLYLKLNTVQDDNVSI